MLYVVYLDEFGHLGPYIDHSDPRHNTHPVFGLGGFVLPYEQVRPFSSFFFNLKKNLLDFEIRRSGEHPAKWEKKGSALYTIRNIEKYPQLRRGTFRILNKIRTLGGYVISVGVEKRRGTENHNSKKLFLSVLREVIKRLDQECNKNSSKFLLVLDEQERNVMRAQTVEAASIEMYGNSARNCLIEPPMQVESHLYQTVQCADWICGILGRLTYAECQIEGAPDNSAAVKFFKERIENVAIRSGIRRL